MIPLGLLIYGYDITFSQAITDDRLQLDDRSTDIEVGDAMQIDSDGASVKLEVFDDTVPLPTENGPLLTEVPLSPIPAPDNESTIAKHLRLMTAADPQVSEDFFQGAKSGFLGNERNADSRGSRGNAKCRCSVWVLAIGEE